MLPYLLLFEPILLLSSRQERLGFYLVGLSLVLYMGFLFHPQRRRMRKKMIRMTSRKPRLPGQINQRPLLDRPTTKQPERPTVVPLPIRTMNNRLSLSIEMLLISFTAESPLIAAVSAL